MVRKYDPEPPCDHYDAMIGTVTSGDLHSGPHCGVATCADCVQKSRGYCTMRTGLPCSKLLTYEEARKQSAR